MGCSQFGQSIDKHLSGFRGDHINIPLHSISNTLYLATGLWWPKVGQFCPSATLRFSTTRRRHVQILSGSGSDPAIKLYGTPIPAVTETKFLSLVFNRKLTFAAHIKYLKDRCLKALNLLRIVVHKDWGADGATLLEIYWSHIRSKLDFGCVVHGSARPSVLESLDRVQNAALRTCLGAFRTSPIPSLHVEAGELPLYLRRQQFSLQYIV